MAAAPHGGRIPIKGPAILAPAIIKDIVERRFEQGASKKLAAKHHISQERVRNIWREYYGSTLISQSQGGLVKPLPTVGTPIEDLSTRRVKTNLGVFSVKEPKVMTAEQKKADAKSRAAPVRKIEKKAAAAEQDLELDPEALAEMGDSEARVIAGEVEAGNNSELLREAINALVLTNKNLSSATKKALRAAYTNSAGGDRKPRAGKYTSDDDNSCALDDSGASGTDTESSYETEDDSAADDVYDAAYEPAQGRASIAAAHPLYARGQVRTVTTDNRPARMGIGVPIGGPQGAYQGGNYHLRGADPDCGPGLSVPLDLGGAYATGGAYAEQRAQPLYSAVPGARAQPRPLQADSGQAGGPQPALYPAQHYAGQEGLQPHNLRYGAECYQEPSRRNEVHCPGGSGLSKVIPGIPGLRRKLV